MQYHVQKSLKGKVVFYTSLLESGLCPDFKIYRLSLFRDFQIFLSGLPAKRLDRALSEQLVPMGKGGLSHVPTRNQRPWSTRIYRNHVKVRARDQGNLQTCSFYATKKGPASPPMRDPSHSNDLISKVQRNAVSKAKPRSPIRTTKAPEHRQWACNSGPLGNLK